MQRAVRRTTRECVCVSNNLPFFHSCFHSVLDLRIQHPVLSLLCKLESHRSEFVVSGRALSHPSFGVSQDCSIHLAGLYKSSLSSPRPLAAFLTVIRSPTHSLTTKPQIPSGSTPCISLLLCPNLAVSIWHKQKLGKCLLKNLLVEKHS